MSRGLTVGRVVGFLVAIALVSLFLGQALGQPVLLSYVETGSMAPTLSPGDGFVAIPAALAGPVERGDVVTFRAESVGGGGLTTHRVVGEENGGYVTQGDANPFPDQDGGEPPVTDARIAAVALQVDGSVVVLPGLGTAATTGRGALDGLARPLASATGLPITATRGLAAFGLAAVLALLLGDEEGIESRDAERDSGISTRRVATLVAVAVVLAATGSMVFPAGSNAYEVVSAERDAPGPRVIAAGGEETTNYTVANGGLVPIVSYLSGGEGVDVADDRVRVGANAQATTEVTLSAPAETGLYRRTLTEDRYLAILPGSVVDALHRLHPVAPLLAIDALLGLVSYGAVAAGLGRGRSKPRSSKRPSRLGGRLRRWL